MKTAFWMRSAAGIGGTFLFVWLFAGCAAKVADVREEPETTVYAPGADTVVTTPARPDVYATRTVRTRANVRTQPSTSADVVRVLDPGASVGLIAVHNGWFNVMVDSVSGSTGWMWGPLLALTREDRFGAALDMAKPNFGADTLFSAVFYEDNILKVSLDLAWRDLTTAQKQEVVSQIGTAWRAAAQQMGFRPAPEIRFLSNMNYEMARYTSKGQVVVKH
ncbi:MAG TPA: SH3 domain-containing protein [Candidatus Latescibacteria bacterium]|nr:SH3 domain-containing protein [Candidatus Latescibacterota bacterium]HOT37176.1 SH3 domain-containing protein [Candidatus Latescibacterota bacterium]HPK75824.1 SH3 domain-containing protein [Candidatus Latescibacterota bacterium]HRS94540.1 SH3 domain-containing protein [Candidatus Latescibacterota bacterium]